MEADSLYRLLARKIRRMIKDSGLLPQRLQELRLRTGRPLFLQYEGNEYVLTGAGELSEDVRDGYLVSQEEIDETLSCVSGYSLYAFDEEMRQGFITTPGGHRVGMAGKTVMEAGKVLCLRHISFVNIRLSHQVYGCADPVMPYLEDGGEVFNTLIISPPGGGKTTLLRDIIRQVSDGTGTLPGRTVGVVDERSEIAGSYRGIPQNDLGARTDVLDCCTKAVGITMLLRSMSPRVIAVDEIGGTGDGRAIGQALYCGCRLIATIHGNTLEDVRRKTLFQEMAGEQVFGRYIILGSEGGGRKLEILDGGGETLFLAHLSAGKNYAENQAGELKIKQ